MFNSEAGFGMRVFLPFQSAPRHGTSNSECSVIPKEFWDSERAKEGQEEPKFRTTVWIL